MMSSCVVPPTNRTILRVVPPTNRAREIPSRRTQESCVLREGISRALSVSGLVLVSLLSVVIVLGATQRRHPTRPGRGESMRREQEDGAAELRRMRVEPQTTRHVLHVSAEGDVSSLLQRTTEFLLSANEQSEQSGTEARARGVKRVRIYSRRNKKYCALNGTAMKCDLAQRPAEGEFEKFWDFTEHGNDHMSFRGGWTPIDGNDTTRTPARWCRGWGVWERADCP